MNIITISRQFGSGGREIGNLVAKKLGYDYYDSQIITFLSDSKQYDEGYVNNILTNHEWHTIPLARSNSFISYSYDYTRLIVEEKNVVESIAKAGNNFVIVGKNSDVFLKEYNPFKIFVCADFDYRVKRCVEHSKENEKLNEHSAAKMIKQIDKKRARNKELICDGTWGDPTNYDLCINTTEKDLEKIADQIVALYRERVNGD